MENQEINYSDFGRQKKIQLDRTLRGKGFSATTLCNIHFTSLGRRVFANQGLQSPPRIACTSAAACCRNTWMPGVRNFSRSTVVIFDFASQGALLHGGRLQNADSRKGSGAFTKSTPRARAGCAFVSSQILNHINLGCVQ